MYYPYFRGKQNELIAIRESAELMASSQIIPIIEPVRFGFGGLTRAIDALIDAECPFILVVNPQVGELSEGPTWLDREMCATLHDRYSNFSIGFIAHASTSGQDVTKATTYPPPVTVIHNGYTQARSLLTMLEPANVGGHIFIDEECSRLYRRHFTGVRRILIKDGFTKRKNREHPPAEHFSDLHITYSEEGVNGFGDFLIVGDVYSESGGPAYAVAIHMTYIDPSADNDMFVKHYVSDRQLDPTDPGGKFLEALDKLASDVISGRIPQTNAVEEFMDLHQRRHFPGLGYVKKLSMKHHLEVMAAQSGQS